MIVSVVGDVFASDPDVGEKRSWKAVRVVEMIREGGLD